MLKSKKSKFVVISILSIVVLLCFIPLIGNLDYFFGMKAVKNQHIDGDVDVSVNINVELRSGIFFTFSYIYYIEFEFTPNGGVTDVEVEGINYNVYHNEVNIYTSTPNVFASRRIDLLYGDNLSCQGSVDLNYQLNSIPQNDTVNFNPIYTHNIREQDAYNYLNVKTGIFIAYLASFFILPVILFFIIHPDFYEPSKGEKEKSEEYLNFLEKEKRRNKN